MDVVGTWFLESFLIESPQGVQSNWGTETRGMLIYSPAGHVSVSINKKVEQDPSQSEAENILDSLLFYAGTYSVDGNTIRHQVKYASNPARIGKEMIRFAAEEGGSLTLTTPPEAFGRAILTWRRA